MIKNSHIIFWFRYITPHISCVLNSILSIEPGMTITILAFEDLPAQRKLLGWKEFDHDRIKVIKFDPESWWSQGKKFVQDNPDAFNVFLGFWTDRRMPRLIFYAQKLKRKVVVLNEAYSKNPVGYTQEEFILTSQIKVVLRPVLYQFAAFVFSVFSKYPSNLCIMPISLIAKDQLIQAGFHPKAIYPFGYFAPKYKNQSEPLNLREGMNLIVVASILKIKGIDISVEAVQKLNNEGFAVSLDIYGSGEDGSINKEQYANINHRGIVPLEMIQSIISRYDALILPSRHDGWGVVVNEALLQGVPVIVSDRVGAKCLIEKSRAGLVFKSGSPGDLADKIKMLGSDPDLYRELHCNAAKVGEKISPECAAKFLLDVLDHHFYQQGDRPTAVWCGELV